MRPEARQTPRAVNAIERMGAPQEVCLLWYNDMQEMLMYCLRACLDCDLQKRFQEEAKERKKLHNAVLDMKGAIRVFCRVRPPQPGPEDAVVGCNNQDNTVTVLSGRQAFQCISLIQFLGEL